VCAIPNGNIGVCIIGCNRHASWQIRTLIAPYSSESLVQRSETVRYKGPKRCDTKVRNSAIQRSETVRYKVPFNARCSRGGRRGARRRRPGALRAGPGRAPVILGYPEPFNHQIMTLIRVILELASSRCRVGRESARDVPCSTPPLV
jgi:hypothetical protein